METSLYSTYNLASFLIPKYLLNDYLTNILLNCSRYQVSSAHVPASKSEFSLKDKQKDYNYDDNDVEEEDDDDDDDDHDHKHKHKHSSNSELL